MDDYWRFEDALDDASDLRQGLIAGGYKHVPKSATWATLSAEWMRMQCGLLHYDACKTDELKRFISDRRVQVQVEESEDAQSKRKRAPGRRQMIKSLQQCDDTQTFDRFLQLPNELQSLVCELYMDYASTLSTPAQPPLARTSRHLRQLTLPIFYSTQRFALAYDARIRGEDWGLINDVDEVVFKPTVEARLWLSALSSVHLACVRSLFLISDSFDGINIDLEKSKLGFNVTVMDLSLSMGGIVTDRQRQGLVRELSKVLKKVECVEGMRRLKMDDVHAFRRALEAAYVDLDLPLGLDN